MPRGGARKGAGRKPGAKTQRTRAIADRISAASGTPLEVMVDAMGYFHRTALQAVDDNQGQASKAASDAFAAAASIAKDAAPYVHPRMAAIDANAKDDSKIVVVIRDESET